VGILGRLTGARGAGAGRDALVTGVPRSGTTLACHLLNKVPDVVALHEPMDVHRFFGLTDADDVCREVERFCRRTRESVIERGVAPSKQVGGKVPDNPVGSALGERGLRARIVSKGEVTIDAAVTPGFTLVVKHPGLFTVFLAQVAPRFPLVAIVRNPLSVLCSWNGVDLHIRNGRAPATERLAPDLSAALEKIPDATSRQVHLVDWYFERYRRLLRSEQVLRYEDVVASRGRALCALVPGASALDEDLTSRNKSDLYARDLMQRLGERLLADDGSWRRFYAPSDVEALLR
jgi:hypothetical protein